MGVVTDIAKSYRAPRVVLRHRLAGGENEGSALVTLMLACGLIFVAQWPRLSRLAFETGQEVQMLMGATLLSWLFIMPLVFYVLSGIVAFVLRVLKTPATGFETRMALFGAFSVPRPVALVGPDGGLCRRWGGHNCGGRFGAGRFDLFLGRDVV